MKEDEGELPAFAQKMIAAGKQGFSEAMIFHRNKAAWLLAQALGCMAKVAEFETGSK